MRSPVTVWTCTKARAAQDPTEVEKRKDLRHQVIPLKVFAVHQDLVQGVPGETRAERTLDKIQNTTYLPWGSCMYLLALASI